MKIQLDFDNKILTLMEQVNLFDFVEKLSHYVPDWEKWKLSTNVENVVHWTEPVKVPQDWWRNSNQFWGGQPIGSLDHKPHYDDLVLRGQGDMNVSFTANVSDVVNVGKEMLATDKETNLNALSSELHKRTLTDESKRSVFQMPDGKPTGILQIEW